MNGLFARARSFWRGLRGPARLEAEMEEEMRFHLEMETERLVRDRGLDPGEARRQAAVAFGGRERFKEQGRDVRGLTRVTGLSLDFKLGARMLVRYPGLTLVGGFSMAVAIAAGAATFELVTQIAHPRLPLEDGDRVVGIRSWNAATNGTRALAVRDFVAWRGELRSVEELGAFRTVRRNLVAAGGQAEPVAVAEMTASGFRVARVAPLHGRPLVEDDERAGAAPVVVIGHDLWRSRFGGDPAVVGRTVQLGSTRSTVVGVMPEGFAFPVRHGLWAPLRPDAADPGPGGGPGVHVFGRLAPGVSLAQAQGELSTLGRRAAADSPETHRHLRPQVMPYAKSWSPYRSEGIPWGVVTAAGYSINALAVMFLVLVCANVATLVFARTATREAEIVVRSALGASRGRIAMQLFAEALVLGAVAAAAGLAAARLGLRWGLDVVREVLMELPFWFSAGISARTVLYAGALTVLGALVAGVVPALKVTGRGMQGRLRQAAVGGASLRFGRLWTGIIVTQVALTVAFVPLVVVAGLDVDRIRGAGAGFAAGEYLSARLETDPEAAAGGDGGVSGGGGARSRATLQELARRLAAEPGVTAVAFAGRLPGADHPRTRVEVEGLPAPPRPDSVLRAQTAAVDPGFFDAFGAPVLAGRGFHPADTESAARVAVVNQGFVRAVLGGRNAVGRRVRFLDSGPAGDAPGPWYEIVGVVRQLGLTTGPDPAHAAGIYRPMAPGGAGPVYLAVHLSGAPEPFAPRLRVLAAAVDPTLRLYELRPLDQVRQAVLTTYTFWVGIAALAACVVLLLSTTGIYALMAFTVARRTREIGIRVALGADRRRIVGGIFSRAFRQVGLGVALGTALLVSLAGAAGSPLVREAGVLAAAVALLVGVCMLACVVPARRALRVEPTEAMRADA